MGVSEGVGFPKHRIRKFGGELSPNEAPSLDWALHTQGVSEGMGFPICRILTSAVKLSPSEVPSPDWTLHTQGGIKSIKSLNLFFCHLKWHFPPSVGTLLFTFLFSFPFTDDFWTWRRSSCVSANDPTSNKTLTTTTVVVSLVGDYHVQDIIVVLSRARVPWESGWRDLVRSKGRLQRCTLRDGEESAHDRDKRMVAENMPPENSGQVFDFEKLLVWDLRK